MSVANKLSYLGETKEEIREGLNKLGGNISKSDTFRSYADAIEEIYDSMPKVEESDVESATLDGTIKGGLTIDPKGNTSQDTTTGKNLYAYGNYEVNTTYYFKEQLLLENYEKNSTYTLSFDININEAPFNISVGCGNTGYASDIAEKYNLSNGHNTLTFTTNNANYSNLYLRCPRYSTSGTQRTGVVSNIQLEKGNSATSYEPYTGGIASPNPDYPQPVKVVTGDNTIKVANSDNTEYQELQVNLGELELCEIGTSQDYIYKENDKWYLHKEIGKVVLNGSENWDMRSTANGNRFYLTKNDAIIPTSVANPTIVSNNFSYMTPNASWTQDIIGISLNTSVGYGQILLKYNTSDTDTVAKFKTWLGTHNTIAYYQLATPTNEEIEDTNLIEQLDNLQNAMSYKGQTNVMQNNNDLPFKLDLKAILDWRNNE